MEILAVLGLSLFLQSDDVDWVRSPDVAVSRALKTGRPVLLYLYDR